MKAKEQTERSGNEAKFGWAGMESMAGLPAQEKIENLFPCCVCL